MTSKLEQAREAAWLEYLKEPSKKAGDNWPFRFGFDAGYKAAQPQWVSVEERLPSEMVKCLIKIHTTDPKMLARDVPEFEVDTAVFFPHSLRWISARFWEVKGVIAWMPLPDLCTDDNTSTDG